MKALSKSLHNETGAIGWVLLWAIGIPVPDFTRAVHDARVHVIRNSCAFIAEPPVVSKIKVARKIFLGK